MAQHGLAEHGIRCAAPGLDLARMQARKDTVVRQNNDGIQFLFKKNKVTFLHGSAAFRAQTAGGWELAVRPAAPSAAPGTVRARHVIARHGLESAAAARRAVRRDPRAVQHRRAGAGRGAAARWA